MYLNPLNFGMTEGSNGSSQLGVGTLRVNVNNSHQFNQDFTKVQGTHAFKFGYEWLWMNYINHDISNPRLTLGFGQSNGSGGTVGSDLTVGLQGNGNSIPNTGGISLAAIMLGYVSTYSYAQQGASNLPVDSNHSFYVQDDWRIRPNLTLNIGVRYSNETPAHSKFPGAAQCRKSDGTGQLLYLRLRSRRPDVPGGRMRGRLDPPQGLPMESRQQ